MRSASPWKKVIVAFRSSRFRCWSRKRLRRSYATISPSSCFLSLALSLSNGLHRLQQLKVNLPENRLCDLSHLPVNGRPHYLYPDGSCFLQTALIDEMSHILPPQDYEHVLELQREINRAKDRGDA